MRRRPSKVDVDPKWSNFKDQGLMVGKEGYVIEGELEWWDILTDSEVPQCQVNEDKKVGSETCVS